VDIWEANGLSGAYDSSVFDSNVLVVPMGLDWVGITPGDVPTFAVATYSPYATDPSQIVDATDTFTFDPFDPPVWFDSDPGAEDSLWYVGQPGTDVTVHRPADGAETDLLVLHTHNDLGGRAQVVDVTVQPPKDTSTVHAFAPHTVFAGESVAVSVVVSSTGAPPTGTVEVREGDRLLGTARVTTPHSTGGAVVHVRGLSPGPHELTVTYAGNDRVEPSSTTVDVTVLRPCGYGYGWPGYGWPGHGSPGYGHGWPGYGYGWPGYGYGWPGYSYGWPGYGYGWPGYGYGWPGYGFGW
jgi:hypothetical protein